MEARSRRGNPGRTGGEPFSAPGAQERIPMTREAKKIPNRLLGALCALCLATALACTDSTGQYSGSSQKAQVPAAANLTSGIASYANECAVCHAADGSGMSSGAFVGNPLKDCESCRAGFDALQSRIHATMPERDPAACRANDSDVCARDTAAHILCAFNPDLAEGCELASTKAVVPPEANKNRGATLYRTQFCQFCHGPQGEGTAFGSDLTNCQVCRGAFGGLQSKIHTTMPPSAPNSCTNDCAMDTAAHVLCAFNPQLAEGCESPKAVIPATANLAAGAASYASLCSACHGPGGGAPGVRNLIGANCATCQQSFSVLHNKIHNTMPNTSPIACVNECAENVAAHIFCSFNPDRAEGCPGG